MKCLRCEKDNPVADAQFCPRCGAPARHPEERSTPAASYADLQRELTEALEQQTATSEILRVISSSPTEYQPVFNTIVRRAGVVCGAVDAMLWTVDGDELVVRAHHGPLAAAIGARQPIHGSVAGCAVREARIVQVEDLTEADDFPVGRDIARRLGWRTTLSAPLLREGVAIGAILIRRNEVRFFTEKQIALLQTFADQAVIAIENVRLFNELQDKNKALTQANAQVTETLERQTATSEILGVISSSPTDVQPVFDTIVQSARRLCEAQFCHLFRFDGKLVHFVAHHGLTPEGIEAVRRGYPMAPGRSSAAARSILRGAVEHIPDVHADPEYGHGAIAKVVTSRSNLAVPMLRDGVPIGAIVVARPEAGLFTDTQIELLKTFADQAVIAIENVRLFTELQEKNRALTRAHAQVTESLEQQTATSEILRVISNSPTDVQPVFDTIVQSASQLCDGLSAIALRYDGAQLHLAAQHNPRHGEADAVARFFPRPAVRESANGRAILERIVVHIPDATAEPGVAPEILRAGIRAVLVVPMLREGEAIGTIAVSRGTIGPFSQRQIDLLKTFADQAVIAIENVRLFTQLEARNRDLATALEKQTATAEILRVISRSPTDLQPVFDELVVNARRLLHGYTASLLRLIGDELHLAASSSTTEEGNEALRSFYPVRLGQVPLLQQAIRDREPLMLADIETDPRVTDGTRGISRVRGYRSMLSVPLTRSGQVIGVIGITRQQSGRFASEEIDLLRTFADQAVIAIENVRLFTELQEKNSALTQAHAQVTESLEQQIATGDILKVISQSPTDVQSVFDTIARSVVRLCGGVLGGLYRFDGELIHQVAHYNYNPEGVEAARRSFPSLPTRALAAGRTMIDRAVVHIPDVERDAEYQQTIARALSVRSILSVPMLRDGTPIGAIAVARAEAGRFSDSQIELLKTFADQAVIAIENVRLFTELQARTADLMRSVEQLTALGEVGHAVSSTLDLEAVLNTIVSRAVQLSGLDGGVVFEYDAAAEEFVHRVATETGGALAEARRTTRVRKGEGVVGQTALTLEPAQVLDITVPGAYESRLRENLIESGVRAILAVPIVREGELIGCLVVSRNRPGEFPAETIELLRTFATQSALAIQNARLFRELADKSRELEVASQHKSEFLANMSHELRTPLNAIIGFSEVLSERMFGELNEKQDEYLKDIHASGQHLLSLINDILDLSKIEAGRMELELTEFDLPLAIDNALTLVRERAARRSITLRTTVDERLGQVLGDERKIRQVLLNLLSNAIKFTPEGGRIDVKAKPVDRSIEVSVSDTGVGISPEDQEAVFEEFRQVGTADKKVEGTGLGLALSRKFIELHGGKIWVKSQVGVGSTFTFTVPVPVHRGE